MNNNLCRIDYRREKKLIKKNTFLGMRLKIFYVGYKNLIRESTGDTHQLKAS